jgi:WD40 repeat protein
MGRWQALRLIVAAALVSIAAIASASEPIYLWQKIGFGYLARSVAFSHSGNVIAASQGLDGYAIKLWNSQTGAYIRTLVGSGHSVEQIVFSPDDQFIIGAGHDFYVRVWRVSDGQMVHAILQEWHVSSVAWTPSGDRFLSGNLSGTVRIYSSATGQLLRTVSGGGEGAMAVSPDGKHFASASGIHGLEVGRTAPIPLQGGFNPTFLEFLTYSPNGQSIAGVYRPFAGTPMMMVWNAQTGAVRFQVGIVQLTGMDFSPDGTTLISCEADSSGTNPVRRWSAVNGAPLGQFGSHPVWVRRVKYSPDGNFVACADYSGQIPLWNVATGALVRTFPAFAERIDYITHAPDGESFIASGWTTVALRRSSDGEVVREFPNVRGTASFSADGTLLGSPSAAGPIVSRVSDASIVATLPQHQNNSTNAVAISPSNTLAACAGGYMYSLEGSTPEPRDPTLRVYTIPGGQLVFTGTNSLPVKFARFTPDGTQVVAAGDDGFRIYNTATWSFTQVSTPIKVITLNKAGTTIATADGTTVRLWDLATNSLIRTFEGNAFAIAHLSFSADGKVLATSSYVTSGGPSASLSQVCFWRLLDNQLVDLLDRGIGTGVLSFELSPTNSTYMFGTEDRCLFRAQARAERRGP